VVAAGGSTPGVRNPDVSAEHLEDRARETVRRVFPASDAVNRYRAAATTGTGYADSVTVLVARANDVTLGLAVVENVRGRDQPITILLAVDTTLAMVALEILAYREPYGGEIKNSVWRRQFLGATPGTPLRHGRQIRNITGATISARAVTAGVNRFLERLPSLAQRLGIRP
jgi:Na+-translocating ferredoxin:NAD+ oxidoreductase RnfG subunit